MKLLLRAAAPACLVLACGLLKSSLASADTFNVQTFAGGSTVGGTSPDSVEYGDGSLWVAYQNGADSAGASGSSTVVRYSTTGSVINTWSVSGNVDGLRVDPGTGLVWALQNNDGNSALTVINPLTNSTKAYSYGSTYTANGNSAGRGFDDAVFQKGQVYLSETNPASGSQPVVLKLTTGLNNPPLQVSGLLNSTFTGLNLATGTMQSTTITDSDSLIKTPTGDLALTGEADQEIVWIHNAGLSTQTESFVHLLGTDGKTISGNPDDTAYATSTSGTFYLTDTKANKVYQIAASGLTPGSAFIDVGDEFGSLNTTTGVVTPIFTGISPHGVQFVPSAAAVPEPAAFGYAAFGILGLTVLVVKRRKQVPDTRV